MRHEVLTRVLAHAVAAWSASGVVAAWAEEKAQYTLAAYPSGCSGLLRNCVHYIRVSDLSCVPIVRTIFGDASSVE